MRKTIVLGLALSLMGTFAGAAFAAGRGEGDAGTRSGLVGWKKVAPGVWSKASGGKVETYAIGAQGMKWALTPLRAELTRLMDAYLADQKPDVWNQIEAHMEVIRNAEAAARGEAIETGEAELQGAQKGLSESCSYDYAHANAYPLNPGVAASADAVWCWTDISYPNTTVHAHAHAEVTSGGITTFQTQDCTQAGTGYVACVASASVSGSGKCLSDAYSYVFFPSGGHWIYYERSDKHCGCTPWVACAIEAPVDER
ncbi:MAG TPA: hypothetical protein VLQ45_23340 [Thermoanaerobaculia bacterium]|nr:hypothetical protein [Thermoanaerobaculia bacterium]